MWGGCVRSARFIFEKFLGDGEVGKDILRKWKPKKARVAILISDKMGLKDRRQRRTLHND